MLGVEPPRAGAEPFPGYRLRRRLGAGGFADVWEAETGDGQHVALKYLPSRDRQVGSQEVRSLQVVRELHHPNLVKIFGVWCQPGYLVIGMELGDCSLQDLLDSCEREMGKPVTPELVCRLLRQAAEAIDFMNAPRHQVGGRPTAIRHGDIKPSNLLLFGDTVKLADFGLTTWRSSPSQAIGGTPAFAAPEVFQGRPSDRTDQFALALSYCILRSGRLPFPDPPRGFVRGYVRPPADLTMLSPREVPVIARALSPFPSDRWPSCVELIDRLSRVAG